MSTKYYVVHTTQSMSPFYRFMYQGADAAGAPARSLLAAGAGEVESLSTPVWAADTDNLVPLARRRDRIPAGSAREAVLKALDRIVGPRRVRIRELNGPPAILQSLDRATLEAALEATGPASWRYVAAVDEVLEFTCSLEGA